MSSRRSHDKAERSRHRLKEIELIPCTSKYAIGIKVLVDNTLTHELPTIKKGQSLCWKSQSLPCDVQADSELTIQVTEFHILHENRVELVKCLVSEVAKEDSVSIGSNTGIFTVKLTFLNKEEAKQAYSEALVKVQQAENKRSLLEKSGRAGKAFKVLLDLGSVMSDLDPTGGAKVAFAVCTKAWEYLEAQEKQVAELNDFVENLAEMTPSVKSVKELADASLGETVAAMLNLIEDASLFILNFKSRSSWVQNLYLIIDSTAQDQIRAFVGKFRKLKEEFDRRVEVQNFETIQMDSIRAKLNELKPVDLASYDPNRVCLKGTRTKLIVDILSSAQQPGLGRGLLWVYGLAGLGKSSIAASVCQQLKDTGSHVTSFFCKRDQPELRDPRRVLATIIHGLAMRWKWYGEAVVAALRADPSLHTQHIQPLYNILVSTPLRSAGEERPSGTFVLVVDALDECGDSGTRKQLLICLRDMSQLVPWFKIIVTSRPNPDIQEFFGQADADWLTRCNVLGYDALDDIRIFVQDRLANVSKIEQWPPDAIEVLSSRSSGLFIWARTACKFILDGHDPCKRLEQVLVGTPRLADPSAELDALYTTAVKVSAEDGDKDNLEPVLECLRAVVVTAANTPLSVSSLEKVLHGRISAYTLNRVLLSLASVLYLDQTQDGAIRISHPSFMDYITDPLRSKELCVNLEKENTTLAEWCLDVMLKELKFNICGLETSHRLNRNIPDLDARVKVAIGPHLNYSCLYWASHFSKARKDTLDAIMGKFLLGKELLYWIEALSLLGTLGVALSSLLLLTHDTSSTIKAYSAHATDIYRFVLGFYEAISESTPHLYISALAFVPKRSGIGQRMQPLFVNSLAIVEGGDEGWSQCLRSISVSSAVKSIAVSPNGRRIVSGSDDQTVRIWDAETGEPVLEPLRGHSGHVASVAFSQDGRRIVSGSDDQTVRIWDAETGEPVLEPLRGHSNYVRSVAFSQDGRRIVSGSSDQTVRIWDAETGEPVLEPLRGHSGHVASVAFSQDGRRIVSGSDDQTVRIWDAETGEPVLEPLRGHSNYVRSVAFSQDGRRIVSGSDDQTVRIWDAETGEPVLEPLRGHSGYVWSVAFSQDGRRIVSGSDDQTVRIWDAETGEPVLEPLRGHSDYVQSVAFSQDGRRIVSGSDDQTVRIWDAETGEPVLEPLRGHSNYVRSVAFSQDGRRIVSGSDDQTVRIWDAETGEPVLEPLRGHSGYVWSVAFSQDGRRIVSGSDDQTVRIWDAETGEPVLEPLRGHSDYVQSVAFSQDGRRIVSGSDDQTVRIWDAETGEPVLEPLRGHSNYVRSVAFSQDGRRIVSGSSDQTVRIWDAETGEPVLEPLRGHSGYVWSVAFSQDGRRIVSGSSDQTVRIWDAETGEPVLEPLRGHSDYVQSVAFSQDGRRIVSGSDDQTVRIWDAETGEPVLEPLRGHSGYVWSVAFSQDGRRIVSGSSDQTVRIWDAEMGTETLEALRSHLPGTEALIFAAHSGSMLVSTASQLARHANSQGWISMTEGGLLLWLPSDHRRVDDSLICISETSSHRRMLIDFSRFVHGSSWSSISDT